MQSLPVDKYINILFFTYIIPYVITYMYKKSNYLCQFISNYFSFLRPYQLGIFFCTAALAGFYLLSLLCSLSYCSDKYRFFFASTLPAFQHTHNIPIIIMPLITSTSILISPFRLLLPPTCQHYAIINIMESLCL